MSYESQSVREFHLESLERRRNDYMRMLKRATLHWVDPVSDTTLLIHAMTAEAKFIAFAKEFNKNLSGKPVTAESTAAMRKLSELRQETEDARSKIKETCFLKLKKESSFINESLVEAVNKLFETEAICRRL